MRNKNTEHKLITFFDTESEYERVQKEIDEGWILTSMIANGKSFVGLLEYNKKPFIDEELVVRIPPRKKIKINS